MDSMESLLTKKLEELELENTEAQSALLSKITFLKYLLTAEIGGNASSNDPETSTLKLRLEIARNNLEELESMANQPFFLQSRAQINSKIAYTKSLIEEAFIQDFSSISCHNQEILTEEKENNVSASSCFCTSSCLDVGEEKEKGGEEEEGSVSRVRVRVRVNENGERRKGKFRAVGAMVGVFTAAAVGVAVGSFFSEKGMMVAYLVPT